MHLLCLPPTSLPCWWLWSAVLLSRSSEKVFSSSHLLYSWSHVSWQPLVWVISCADTEAEVTPAHRTLCTRTLLLEGGVQMVFPFTFVFTNNVTLKPYFFACPNVPLLCFDEKKHLHFHNRVCNFQSGTLLLSVTLRLGNWFLQKGWEYFHCWPSTLSLFGERKGWWICTFWAW